MDPGDHLDELGVAGGVGVLVDVAAIRGERPCDELPPLGGVGRPPQGEVGLDEGVGVVGGGVSHAVDGA